MNTTSKISVFKNFIKPALLTDQAGLTNFRRFSLRALPCWLAIILIVAGCQVKKTSFNAATSLVDSAMLFEPAPGTYTSMRIPALILTQKGTLLAFAAGRAGNGSDWAEMDLVMKRSVDGGRSWSALTVVAPRRGEEPTDNPVPIIDKNGVIHLLYQRGYEFAYHIRSEDDGLSWSQPEDITATFSKFKTEYDWKVLAMGPGHGLRLKNGRLVVPVWLANSDVLTPKKSHKPSRVATIYSDDNGATWHRGELIPDVPGFTNPSETMAVELADGRVMLSIRNESSRRRRGVSYSNDGISGWSAPSYFDSLFEPTVMATIIRVNDNGRKGFLFVNPDSERLPLTQAGKPPRANLTAQLSYDEGKTWPIKKVINPGFSGYSDVAVKDDTVYLIYEIQQGQGSNRALSIMFKRFSLGWLKN